MGIRRTWLWQRSAGFEDRPLYEKKKNLDYWKKEVATIIRVKTIIITTVTQEMILKVQLLT